MGLEQEGMLYRNAGLHRPSSQQTAVIAAASAGTGLIGPLRPE